MIMTIWDAANFLWNSSSTSAPQINKIKIDSYYIIKLQVYLFVAAKCYKYLRSYH